MHSTVQIQPLSNLDKNESLEIGLKLARSDGSRLDFLITGSTTACLKDLGTTPVARLLLIIARADELIASNESFNSRGGTMSVQHVLFSIN